MDVVGFGGEFFSDIRIYVNVRTINASTPGGFMTSSSSASSPIAVGGAVGVLGDDGVNDLLVLGRYLDGLMCYSL
jgi:hypothetical protein